MIDKDRIKAESEAFFEWPSKDKMYVTTTSMLIFTNVIAEMARTEEREACAKVCEAMKTRPPSELDDSERGYNASLRRAAEAIRLRSNAELCGGTSATNAVLNGKT